MSFGENLVFLRKKKGMTQENLAEALGVSRQTISKWESDGAFPETDKILVLCDMFSCNMDDLLRGAMQQTCTESDLEYDRHMNRFAVAIAAGVGLILFGLTLLLLLTALGAAETVCVMVFLFFCVIAVTIFIVSGISHENFIGSTPTIGQIYDDKTIRKFNRKFTYWIAIPVACILIGVIWIIGAQTIPMPERFEQEAWETLLVVPFMLTLAVAVPCIVWAGIQKSKYNIDEYNREAKKVLRERAGKETLAGKISGCIMLVAAAAYLVMGFIWNLWHPGWVVFPVGGILCGIITTLFGDKE